MNSAMSEDQLEDLKVKANEITRKEPQKNALNSPLTAENLKKFEIHRLEQMI